MPVYIDREKQRWRFSFNRIIKSIRHRATKLLPAAWGRAKAEAYDREETARLYAVATGVERPEPLIERAVELYLDHHLPRLRKKARRPNRIAQELAHLAGYLEGRPMSALADVSAALHHKHWGSSARYAHLVTEHTERVLFGIGARKMHTARRRPPSARRA